MGNYAKPRNLHKLESSPFPAWTGKGLLTNHGRPFLARGHDLADQPFAVVIQKSIAVMPKMDYQNNRNMVAWQLFSIPNQKDKKKNSLLKLLQRSIAKMIALPIDRKFETELFWNPW